MDFSAAWADYYRKQGLHAQAQQVLNQAHANQQQQHMQPQQAQPASMINQPQTPQQ